VVKGVGPLESLITKFPSGQAPQSTEEAPSLGAASQPAKDDLASEAAPVVRLKRVFSQEKGYWSDPEAALG
jgi:hypothetical protein